VRLRWSEEGGIVSINIAARERGCAPRAGGDNLDDCCYEERDW
jgi:hypothetical protein